MIDTVQIVERYSEGESISHIAKDLHHDFRTVKGALVGTGVCLRGRSEAVALGFKRVGRPGADAEREKKRKADWQRENAGRLNRKRRERRAADPSVREREASQRRARRPLARREKRRWRRENPDAFRAEKARRRARLVGAEGNVTPEEWAARLEEFGNLCAYCGKDLGDSPTQDHFVPLSKGGSHKIENIVPACGPCNSKKGDRLLINEASE